MDIFIKKINTNSNNIETKKQQSQSAKEFLNEILKDFYKHSTQLLKKESGEPYLEDGFKYVSITHSKDYIVIAFDDYKIGVDIEQVKQRNYKPILKRYNQPETLSLKEFYHWWTTFEAEYKSQTKQETYSFEIENYICTLSHNPKSEVNIHYHN